MAGTKTAKKSTTPTKAKAPAKTAKAPAKTAKAAPKAPAKGKKHTQAFIFVKDFLQENAPQECLDEWTKMEAKYNKILKNQEKKNENKKNKDPNAPKKPPSAYMIFCQENRPRVLEEKKDINATDVMKELGQRWSKIKDNTKAVAPYQKKAEKAKQEYQKAMESYTPPPGCAQKKKTDKPKRAPTSYLIYCKEKRPEVVKNKPELKATEILKVLGEMWREVPEEEKEKYRALSQQAKDELEKTKTVATPAPKAKKAAPKKTKKVEKEPSIEEEDEVEEEEEEEEDEE